MTGQRGVSQDIGMLSRRDVAASQVRRKGEGFSNPPSRASGCRLPLVVGDGWLVAVFIGVKDAVLGPGDGIRTPFWWELLWIDFHFDTVLYFDLDAWGWGFAWAGMGALTRYRGRRARVWVKAVGLQLGDSVGDVEIEIRGRGRRWCLGLWPIIPDVSATGGRACRWLGIANPAPGGVAHRELLRGYWPDVEGMANMPAGRCFRNLFLRIAKGLGTTR